MSVSVIVCTYNRAGVLFQCLNALAHQTCGPTTFEVLIVDNNSTDTTADVAQEFCGRFPNFRYLFEARQGLANSRNVGLAAAAYDICAFTDDDAIVPPGWIDQLLRAFEAAPPATVAVGGEIDPIWETPRPDWLDDELLKPLSAGLGWSLDPITLKPEEWICEVNSAYRKAPLLKHGGFPERLGRIGMNLLSGENAVNILLAGDGGTFYFDPHIRVQHMISSDRITKAWFRRRMYWQGITTFVVQGYLRQNGIATPAWSDLEVPTSERSWAELFDDANDAAFRTSLRITSNLGYLFASQGLVLGR
ncbi:MULTISPECIES: glycosyltransferase [Lichenihabitans]|uniref:glycosyltransferase n=1 Tax=Lichenihabitans TaxID=2723776 RepID=UPI00103646A3|nr:MULTISPECIES: glycosyltransferase family 2 protein [Lichenihabitans]UDL93433.1 glycosyltransferase [Lichenihabitans sp. PAMC28606]